MTKPTVPGIEVQELDTEDSFFAMLEHFGMEDQPTQPAGLLVLPAPKEVPDFELADTEWSRLGARMRSGKL
jgi:hypothetical protein